MTDSAGQFRHVATLLRGEYAAGADSAESRLDPSALFRAIIESADDAIFSTDLHTIITSWNRAAERL